MSARRAASAAWRGVVQGMKPTTHSFGPSASMAFKTAMSGSSTSLPRSGASVASLLFAGVPKLSVPPSPPPPTFAASAISTSAIAASGGSAQNGSGGGLPASEEESGDADPPHLKRRRKRGHVLSEGDEMGASVRKMRETAEAQAVMEDPMSMLLASRGMPLGISSASLSSKARSLSKGGQDDESDDDDDKPAEKKEAPFEMEALKEIFDTTAPSKDAKDKSDSWGTTKKGAEEIARHLVESNRELEKLSAELGDPSPSLSPSDDMDPELTLAPGEQKYKTLEQMSKDIKDLDECFEVLASVPWLDEDSLQEKELKGVAMHGLLGTLEEVGFGIRAHVHRIWAGERDHGLITECTEAKDQAALISILFHTKKLEEQYGTPRPVKI